MGTCLVIIIIVLLSVPVAENLSKFDEIMIICGLLVTNCHQIYVKKILIVSLNVNLNGRGACLFSVRKELSWLSWLSGPEGLENRTQLFRDRNQWTGKVL